jgi:flagellar basal body-associated protein FliL
VKGDVQEMKEIINEEVMNQFKKDARILTVLYIMVVVLAAPMFLLFKWVGVSLWGILAIVSLAYAFKIEKQKKKFDIQTYKEIVNFLENRQMNENEKQQEFGKRPYQKVILVLTSTLLALVVTVVILSILRMIL